MAEVHRVDEIIAHLRSQAEVGETPVFFCPKPDEFKGLRAVEALRNYLARNGQQRVPFPRAVSDLVAGGTHPGKPRGRQADPARLIAHTLKIALPNKRNIFGWEPDDGTLKGIDENKIVVWLAVTASEPKDRNRPKKAKAAKASKPAANEESESSTPLASG